MTRRVLYVIACGSPAARDVGRLVVLAQNRGWDVCLVTTPDGRKFVDVATLAGLTGHPVRSFYKNPGDPDVLPAPNAIIVVPATVNTITKWAAGIADTLALGLLVEGQGKGLPIVALPFTNSAMGAHPAFLEAIDRLRGWGITVLFGDDVLPLHPPGHGETLVATFPWELTLDAMEARLPGDSHRPRPRFATLDSGGRGAPSLGGGGRGPASLDVGGRSASSPGGGGRGPASLDGGGRGAPSLDGGGRGAPSLDGDRSAGATREPPGRR